MATAYRSSANITNGTAGTTVTVVKPSGIVDTGSNSARDQLVAYIAAEGAPTITPPAGWTLVTSAVDAGNTVTLWCYRKLASSEGASWTWTLGASHRNWGWVGAYTGVDPTTPTTSAETSVTLIGGTTLATGSSNATFPANGQGVSAGAAVRVATGVATTWTHSDTERADLSTNAGAGTDVTGNVGDSGNDSFFFGNAIYAPTLTASQSQTAGVAIGVTLTPYSAPYTGRVGATGLVLEAAFGVDPDSDSSSWTWTDVTSYVHQPAKVALSHGRANRTTVADPSRMEFTLLNLNGEFTSATGTFTASMVRNLPFRVRLTGFGTGNYHRGTAFLASMRPRWDLSTNFAVVDVVAQGRLRRAQRRTQPLHSAAYRSISGVGQPSFTPVAYWSFEDGSSATSAASAIPDVRPASASGVTFAADDTFVGSDSLPTLASTSVVTGTVPTYTATDQWVAVWALKIPSEPAATTTLMEISTTGTASRWVLELAPGTSALHIRAYDSAGVSALDAAVAVTETDFYGATILFLVGVTKNGTGVNYTVWALSSDGNGTGVAGTLASFSGGNATKFRVPAQAGLAGATLGHVAVYTDTAFDPNLDNSTLAAAVVDGNHNERPWARFQRLCTEENVPYIMDQGDNLELTMGPQGTASFISLLRECETVEGCVMNDSGVFGATGLLWFPATSDRLNLTAAMTLDMASGHVESFQPAFDDQDIVNDVEVVRLAGSTARVTDPASIAVEGNYVDQVTANTDDDTFLEHLAGWRVNLGTVRGMRFPAVTTNFRRATSLATTWMSCPLFSRVDITNPPVQYPPDDIAAMLEGYTETIADDTFEATLYLAPYAPYAVGTIADTSGDTSDILGRLSADAACALRAAVSSGATSFDVDPNRTRWTTVADDFDPDIEVRLGGEVVTVSGISTTPATYVAAGAASHADNAAVTPALYAGATTSDLICVLAAIRSSGTGTLSTPTGYTRLPVFAATDNVQLFAKVHSGSESAPTVTPSGGAAGDSVSAFTFGLRGMPTSLTDLADLVVDSLTLLNTSTQNIAYPGLYPRTQEGCVVLAIGWKQDDWTSVATLTGETEAADVSTTTGSDQGLVLDYVIQTTPAVINEGSFVVTGGANAISRGALVALAGGYQTFTISARSVNGVTKAHAAGTTLEVEDPFVLAL